MAVFQGVNGSRHEQSRCIVKNPRGLGFFYAIIQCGGTDALRLFKSSDGVTWTDVQQINASTVFEADMLPIDTGAQFEILVAYSSGFDDAAIDYRRIQIPDSTSSPTVGAEHGVGGFTASYPTIFRDRNGRVHIIAVDWTTTTTLFNVHISGTSETTLVDSPTWTAAIQVLSIANDTSLAGKAVGVPYSSGNLGGVVILAAYQNIGLGTDNFELHGVNITSFDGTTYTLGTDNSIDTYSIASPSGMEPLLSALVDSSDIAHVLYSPSNTAGAPQTKTAFRKTSAASSVAAFGTVSNPDSNTDIQSLQLSRSADSSELIAFYKRSASTALRYRRSPSGTIAWGAEQTISANAHLYHSAESFSVSNKWHLLYTETASPFNVVYAGVVVSAGPDPFPDRCLLAQNYDTRLRM